MRPKQSKADINGSSAPTLRLYRTMVILLAIVTFGVVGLTGVKYINTRRHVSSAVIRQLTVSQVVEYLKDRQG